MTPASQFTYRPIVVLLPLLALLSIWTVFLIEIRLGISFNSYGIFPRSLSGLIGIIASPFIHGSTSHLYNNTVPLAVLLAALCYFYKDSYVKVILFGVLLSGLGTWCMGRPAYHIGASGLIYVLTSFIFFKGIQTKHYRLIAVSLAVVFVYGSTIWHIFPIQDEISWEGHLAGFVTGIILAFTIKDVPLAKVKYVWEQTDYTPEEDTFMQHFDENGNFVPSSELYPEEEEVKVIYTYTTNKED